VRFHRPSFWVFFCQFRVFVKLPPLKMLSAVDGAVVRILHQPHLSIAFEGVELCHRAINIQEHGLRNILRLAEVADNPQRNAQDQLLVAVEEDSEGIAPSLPSWR